MQKEKPVSRKDFERLINGKTKARKYDTAFFITRAKYNKLLQQVKSARANNNEKLEPKVAKLVKRYDVVTTDGVERLAVAKSNNKVIYVSKDELFSVISQVHLETNHGNLSSMTKLMKSKYKNVTPEAITAYLKLCQRCCSMKVVTRSAKKAELKEEDESKENKETKVRKERRKREAKSKESDGSQPQSTRKRRSKTGNPSSDHVSAFKSQIRAPRRSRMIDASTKPFTMGTRTPQRIDFIEMDSEEYYEFNFIVVLRESTTKFVHLRPLRSHSIDELAEILKPIFICFGTPSVLQTSNQDFIQDSVEVLLSKCPTLPTDIKVQASEEAKFFADIETLMLSWVVQNSHQRWYAGLRFVQYIANLTYNKEIGKTPFEAMFGRKGKLDVSSLNLPAELLDGIRTEEDPEEKNGPEEEDAEEERDFDINDMLEVEINDDSTARA